MNTRDRLSCILLLLLAVASRSYAQPGQIPPCYWVDSFNLRLHASYYLLGNTIHDISRQTDESSFNMAAVYRQSTMKNRTVRVTHLNLETSYFDNSDRSPSALAQQLQKKADMEQPKKGRKLILQYDDQGYLVKHINEAMVAYPNYTERDTVSYRYTHKPDGGLRVDIESHSTKHNRNIKPPKGSDLLYSSIYAGEFKKGPLWFHSEGNNYYEFDKVGRPLVMTYFYKGWVNDRIDYDPKQTTMRLFSYDEKGRLLSVRDSLTTLGVLNTMQSYSYKDSPLEGVPELETPLMKQYLATVNNPFLCMVEYSYKYWRREDGSGYYHRDSAKTDNRTYVTVRDADDKLRIAYRKQGQYGEPATLYTSWADSNGVQRIQSTVAGDTAGGVYDPHALRIPITEQHGCIIETYYEHPGGTFHQTRLECSDRREMTGKDGWRLVCYGNYGSHDLSHSRSFFPPAYHQPYCDCLASLTNFMLIDPAGDIRYMFDQGQLYVMEYVN